MAIMSRLARILTLATLLFVPAGAQSDPGSAWTQGFHSRVRLVAGGTEDGRRLAGIEIKLDPGFKTYWRNPGESGLPPRLDWAASSNVAAVELRWPAPERFEDAAGVSFGYHDQVLLPLFVQAKDSTQPVTLSVTVDYGVCKDICIPAHAELSLPLSEDATHRPLLRAALDRVPRLQALGSQGALSVLGIEPVAGTTLAHAVTVRAPGGTDAVLFAEAPENWYVSTSPVRNDGSFLVTIDEKPKGAAGPVPVRLTLVAGDRAVETEVHLDAGHPPR
jgi:DsbC/DsbD-like thiol-disulfide interchange protein